MTQQSNLLDVTAWPAERLILALFAGSAGILLLALGFEHLGGYQPCHLCMLQRWAYYAGIGGGLVAWLLARQGQRPYAGWLLALIGLGFLLNAMLGVYHAGIEWQWWTGPASCSGGGGSLTTEAGGLLNAIENTRIARCDEANWRFAGISMAGWNALISLGLSGLAVLGYRRLL